MATTGLIMAGLTGLAAYLYGPAAQGVVTKMGVFRQLASTPLAHPEDLVVIKDTVHCEDLHYYAPAHTLFTACEDDGATRFRWFPPLGLFADPGAAWSARGSIHTIDPETKVSKRLAFDNFDGPFITHGIDVIPDPDAAGTDAVYIVAVNHVPNELVFPRDGSTGPEVNSSSTPKAASRLEVFHHVLGSGTLQHRHTVRHPLIRTPNDVYAVSLTEFYVTNDHRYYEGLWRHVEDMWPGAAWSELVRATVVAAPSSSEGGSGDVVEAEVALGGLHNPNGLGHGRTADEILLASAVGGTVRLARAVVAPAEGGEAQRKEMVVDDIIDMDSSLDNPSWYADPYADADADGGDDASAFVLGGLTRAVDIGKTGADPEGKEGVLVWYVKPGVMTGEKWNKTLLWQDDGSNIRNVATAVLVGIDPAKEGGRKKAWLFVTGFSSESTVAVKVDLP